MESRTSFFSVELGYYLNSVMVDGKARKLSVSSDPLYSKGSDEVTVAVEKYLSGEKDSLAGIPVDPVGTEFQKKVWNALREIPHGEVVSYSKIAERIGKPSAARAVGNAVGSNPILLLVPCHRVVAKHGLGGFSAEGGIETKKKILSLESAFPEKIAALQGEKQQ